MPCHHTVSTELSVERIAQMRETVFLNQRLKTLDNYLWYSMFTATTKVFVIGFQLLFQILFIFESFIGFYILSRSET